MGPRTKKLIDAAADYTWVSRNRLLWKATINNNGDLYSIIFQLVPCQGKWAYAITITNKNQPKSRKRTDAAKIFGASVKMIYELVKTMSPPIVMLKPLKPSHKRVFKGLSKEMAPDLGYDIIDQPNSDWFVYVKSSLIKNNNERILKQNETDEH